LFFTCWTCNSQAQELEPRSYINIPIGLNFLIVGAAYQDGNILLDPSLLAEDARTRVKHLAMGYLHSFGLFGKSAKIAVAGTYSGFTASGTVDGEAKFREDQGFTDPGVKFSINLLGSPATSLSEFSGYDKQRFILGVGLGLSVPVGAYDPDRLINLGFNRWAIKPEVGVSKMLGRWILEGSFATAFFTDNSDFNGGKNRERDPLSSLQFHVIYRIRPGGFWVSFDVTRFEGGQTTVDGNELDDRLENNRFGATLAFPVNRHNSVKTYVSTGVNSRRGTEYDLVGLAWQYRWGGGL
jgi:hypothetical protein